MFATKIANGKPTNKLLNCYLENFSLTFIYKSVENQTRARYNVWFHNWKGDVNFSNGIIKYIQAKATGLIRQRCLPPAVVFLQETFVLPSIINQSINQSIPFLLMRRPASVLKYRGYCNNPRMSVKNGD